MKFLSLFELFVKNNNKIPTPHISMDTVYDIHHFNQVSQYLLNETFKSSLQKSCILVVYCSNCLIELIKQYNLENNLHGILLTYDGLNGFSMKGVNYEGRYAYGGLFNDGLNKLKGGQYKYVVNGKFLVETLVTITNELLVSLDKINCFLNENKEVFTGDFIKSIPSKDWISENNFLEVHHIFKFVRLRDDKNKTESINVEHPFFIPNINQSVYYKQLDFIDVLMERFILSNDIHGIIDKDIIPKKMKV